MLTTVHRDLYDEYQRTRSQLKQSNGANRQLARKALQLHVRLFYSPPPPYGWETAHPLYPSFDDHNSSIARRRAMVAEHIARKAQQQ